MRIIITLIVALTTMTAFARTQTNETPNFIISPNDNAVYRLFPTQNMWTFIKLNTRNGQTWQVQWSIEAHSRFITPLSLIPRVSEEEERNGRFFLYPTQNRFNFILLDQIDGRIWQVQWSIETENRLVSPIRVSETSLEYYLLRQLYYLLRQEVNSQ